MQNNDALCSPHKLCSECKPNGNICSADNKYYDILGIKGNFLEALQVQKKDLRVCPVQSICSAGCSPISHFLCNVSVQCQRIGRKWMYDQHRTQDISHIRCANIFFAMQDFSGFLRKSTMENGISSSVQPYISLIAHSYQLRHKAFPFRGRYQSQRRHLHSGQDNQVKVSLRLLSDVTRTTRLLSGSNQTTSPE